VVDDPAPAYRQVKELTEPVVVSRRVHAGFNPAGPADLSLLSTDAQSKHARGSATICTLVTFDL
jgi:hypothetical protein